MKIIEKIYELKPYTSHAFDLYFSGLKIGVLDIESTGLSPRNSQFILGGFMAYQNDDTNSACGDYDCDVNSFCSNHDGSVAFSIDNTHAVCTATFKQFFAETLDEEAEVLAAYIAEIDKVDVIITYNGKHFDLAFMNGRLRDLKLHFNELCSSETWPYDLDLYLCVNAFSALRKVLPNLKQKTVENYMGLWSDRSDEIDGGESVQLYGEFLAMNRLKNFDRAEECLRQILLHNADDIMQLSRLAKVSEKCDFHRAMFGLGFPAGKQADLIVEEIKLSNRELIIKGKQRRHPIGYISFADADRPYNLNFDKYGLGFEVTLPLIYKEKITFVDLEEIFDEAPAALAVYPACESGYLVLKAEDVINYRECNHFIKLLLAKIESEI